MKNLSAFLREEKAQKKIIYPSGKKIFNALNLTDFHEVKAVIVGQDPYHGEGQANGLSFSVESGIAKPPSLRNIFKELKSDLYIEEPTHGNLTNWGKMVFCYLTRFSQLKLINRDPITIVDGKDLPKKFWNYCQKTKR